MSPVREVVCADAIGWLKEQPPFESCAFVTSLPDVSELSGFSVEAWKRWFVDAATLVMERCPKDGVAIFFQSDIKDGGVWIDKGWLVHQAAERAGMALLWHKIACRKPPGTICFGRSSYSHLLCYARELRPDPARSSPDVLADSGAKAWTRGMGVEACRLACRFVREHTKCRTVIDPFCGRGTVLAAANEQGLHALGVELCRKRARQAKSLRLEDLEATGERDE